MSSVRTLDLRTIQARKAGQDNDTNSQQQLRVTRSRALNEDIQPATSSSILYTIQLFPKQVQLRRSMLSR